LLSGAEGTTAAEIRAEVEELDRMPRLRQVREQLIGSPNRVIDALR
jgi:hypothetical protein